MADEAKNFVDIAENKASVDLALDRARLARERREAEQRKRLDELRAHAEAAQAQREKRDEERRRRQAEQRARDEDRRGQVEERKRAIWEASVSRREALLQRERERNERLERVRASRSSPRSGFAFGSSTPRLLEPQDSAGFFWPARSTSPALEQMSFFQTILAASTSDVMFASAPLTRRTSPLQLDPDNENKDEPSRQPQQVMWSSVARRRTDLVPTLPSPRAPETRSGDTTPGSRPGSAMSNTTGVVRRVSAAPRKSRPASIAGTGVNTPRGGGDGLLSAATTPSMSRDGSTMAGGDTPYRPQVAPRRPRPVSMHVTQKIAPSNPADGKPPVHRKPKSSKDHDKSPRGVSSTSPGRTLSPSPAASKEPSVAKEVVHKNVSKDKSQVSAIEVTQKLEALQIQNGEQQTNAHNQNVVIKVNDNIEAVKKTSNEKVSEVPKPSEVVEQQKPAIAPKPELLKAKEPSVEKKETVQDKPDDSEMTASMTARRITTEEEAKAALAERRRRAREELEKQAELERQRLQREAEEEMERQRQEEERQRREEEEARELAQLQRRMEEEKLRKAIEAQQQLEREEAERKAREEAERQARLKEDEEKRKAAEEAERLRKEEAEREEKERLLRKQRVEAIMARTRLKKQAEEDKKQQENAASQPAAPAPAAAAAGPTPPDNGNALATGNLLGLDASQLVETKANQEAAAPAPIAAPTPAKENNSTPNNGNVTADLLGMSEQNNTEDKTATQVPVANNKDIDNAPAVETNNGNVQHLMEPVASVGHISANFIQTERMSAEHSQTKSENVPKLLEDDFTAHNGHGTSHNHPLTLQNAI